MSELIIGDQLDLEQLIKKVGRVDENSRKLDTIVSSIVNKYCKELDEFITNIYTLVSDKTKDVPDVDIEYMILQLPLRMYFTSGKLEDLGLREDIARGTEKEKYNNILMKTEGKVLEKESAAELGSQEESIITAINSRAYRKIKARLEYASATLESLKKVITNRISDKELSRKDSR
ncbi:MAG: hypothetical protein RR342_01550 [Bacilli bacterium]